MSTPNSSNKPVIDAARALGIALAEIKYAVSGGAACALLGSSHLTHYINFVVPKGKTVETRNILRNTADFTVEPKTAYTYYKYHSAAPIQISILTPPVLFQEQFDSDTPTVTIEGVEILHPALILNAKCHSIRDRFTKEKISSDSDDINFLLDYFARSDRKPRSSEVPAANKEFFEWFITANHGKADVWVKAGFDIAKGSF